MSAKRLQPATIATFGPVNRERLDTSNRDEQSLTSDYLRCPQCRDHYFWPRILSAGEKCEQCHVPLERVSIHQVLTALNHQPAPQH